MLSVAKFFIATVFLFSLNANARDVHILILQENSPSDCGAEVFDAAAGVYQIGLDGEEISSRAPFVWGNCIDGNVVLPLGQALIMSGIGERVIFMPVGTRGTSLRDWLSGGIAHANMTLALQNANDKNITFDYVLWNGAMVDTGSSVSRYQSDVQKVLKDVKLSTKADKFIISKSIICNTGEVKRERDYRWDPLYKRFPGPDIDRLGKEYFSDGCNLNDLGKQRIAQLWLQAIRKANIENERYQKESLLYYLK